MTTGMSAPPMGTISSTPKSNARPVMAQNTLSCCSMEKTAPRAMIAMMRARLSRCWPRKTSGAPVINS